MPTPTSQFQVPGAVLAHQFPPPHELSSGEELNAEYALFCKWYWLLYLLPQDEKMAYIEGTKEIKGLPQFDFGYFTRYHHHDLFLSIDHYLLFQITLKKRLISTLNVDDCVDCSIHLLEEEERVGSITVDQHATEDGVTKAVCQYYNNIYPSDISVLRLNFGDQSEEHIQIAYEAAIKILSSLSEINMTCYLDLDNSPLNESQLAEIRRLHQECKDRYDSMMGGISPFEFNRESVPDRKFKQEVERAVHHNLKQTGVSAGAAAGGGSRLSDNMAEYYAALQKTNIVKAHKR
ncbi:MAG: hypothetical protein CMF42_01875 [Legionellales bacterium]|nr:hypothetical protein [Legionellales bacterium]|tara:strand:- start:399 stop:1271 length:873 start_codon:yes stop_codon:yes gene_type:complete